MEELLNDIQEIQKYLYGGYKNEGGTNIDWLEVRKIEKFSEKKFQIQLFSSNFQ